MLLNLTSPVGSDFIKDFPGQNSPNLDKIDAYAGPYAIQSYTPVITAGGGGLVLGTGSVATGAYYRIFDQIFYWGEFRFGTSGFNAGSGAFEVSLPFDSITIAPASGSSGGGPIVGTGLTWDTPLANRQPVSVQLRTVNKLQFGVKNESGASGRALGAGIPFTWSASSGINWNVRYQRAPGQ